MEQITRNTYAETKSKCMTIPFGESYFVDRGANPCCIITEKGLIQVDATKNPMYASAWIESIRKISDKEFKYVINTDHHLDHIMCNYCFNAPGITHLLSELEIKKFEKFEPQKLIPFMYSKELYQMLEKRDDNFVQGLMESYEKLEKSLRDQYENLRIIPAEITFGDKLTLNMGNIKVELDHVGGHAPGSILIYLPEEKVLFAGDSVFNDLLPNMAQANTAQWLQVLNMIAKMDVEIIVPGHGHPCDKRALEKLSQYILEVRSKVGELQEKGYKREEVMEEVDMTAFFPVDTELGWTRERIRDWSRDNTGRVFDELKNTRV